MSAPDLVLVGGTVLTVDAVDTVAEAVAVTGGRISAVGSTAEIRALADGGTEVVELDGRTVVPGFVDPHSHVSMGAPYIRHAALHTPPVGTVRTVADLLHALHENLAQNATPAGGLLLGWGYYPDEMDDGGAVTAEILDREFPDHRVAIVHVSGHGGVVNTRILAERGYTDGCADPEGGTIVRHPGTDRPNGVLWENAWMPLVFGMLDTDDDALLAMLHEYARWGVTTVQDGAATVEQVEAIRALADGPGLPVDVRSLVLFSELGEAVEQGWFGADKVTSNGHTVQGVKLILDGSPQGKTAHVTEEYLTGGPGGEQHWHGLAVLTQEQSDGIVAAAYEHGIQVFAHCNGDAAIDQLLASHRAAKAAGATPPGRTVPIHSQVMRLDQLDEYVAEGFEPSMFTIHCLIFGDTHLRNFGQDRAFGISPMRAAIDRGLRPTNHSDYPITPINPLQLLWTSVTRRSTGGVVLGEDQRITPAEGLRSLTIDAAYEHRCEDDRGSVEVGKLADLVVLDANPVDVDVDAIKDIGVVRTVKRGVTVYEAT
ncbi:amidohydrolase [Isoptericola sp. S6320L]|uniref:amidohydrolase n=1 Tax=Isoptericola sp. S6320L TaxID=2926411 RepID=UPI001FF428F3|nr:amidohydrolase [Isoptericola sp. S6320L]MCK0117179.1 amidohydrolase [Isoptericola sp. S6320L]